MKTLILTLILGATAFIMPNNSQAQILEAEYGVHMFTQNSQVYGMLGLGVLFSQTELASSRVGVRYLHRTFEDDFIQVPLTVRSNSDLHVNLGLIGMYDTHVFGLFTYGVGYNRENTYISVNHNFSLASQYYRFNSIGFTIGVNLN